MERLEVRTRGREGGRGEQGERDEKGGGRERER